MLRNYFIVTVRNMLRHSTFSFINILGLAVGMGSAILIGLWVYEEVTYEQQFEGHQQIYRVGVNFYNIGDMAPGPEKFIDEINNYPIVESATRLDFQGEKIIIVNNQKFEETEVYFADEHFFDLFSYDFIQGNPSNALDQPNHVILTKDKALQYFNTTQATGKVLELQDEAGLQQFIVAGVVDTEKQRSHITSKIWFKLIPEEGKNWTSANYYNYVKLQPGVTSEDFQVRLDLLIREKIFPELPTDLTYEDWVEAGQTYHFIPMPIGDIHLKSDLRFEPGPGGNNLNVQVFSLVVIIILIIAGVNYINITTARASKRAKEVGIRKTLGTSRRALVFQFLSESTVVSILAFLLAFLFADLFNWIFQVYTGVALVGSLTSNVGHIVVIFMLTIIIGLLAGVYPAIYISSFKPISALKGQLGRIEKSLFRNVLVIIQFSVSIILIASTIIIYRQLHYFSTNDLGLNKENVIVITNAEKLGSQLESYVEKLKQHTDIMTVSRSARIPTGGGVYVKTFRTPQMQDGFPIQLFYGDGKYLDAMGFHLLKGRNFSEDIASDTAAVLLNEAAVEALELKDPIGTQLNDNLIIKGVISDFNFEGPRKKIEPTAIMLQSSGSNIAIKTAGNDDHEVLSYIKDQWLQLQAVEQMEYFFLDESYAKLVEKEKIMSKAMSLFSILAIIISSLGLYGLSAFICDQRTKEIGVRKVFGARARQIVIYLNLGFTRPIIISILIAIPITIWLMNFWLNNFAYRTSIEVWVIAISCFAALFISWITVTWQSLRAAWRNPVESLKSE